VKEKFNGYWKLYSETKSIVSIIGETRLRMSSWQNVFDMDEGTEAAADATATATATSSTNLKLEGGNMDENSSRPDLTNASSFLWRRVDWEAFPSIVRGETEHYVQQRLQRRLQQEKKQSRYRISKTQQRQIQQKIIKNQKNCKFEDDTTPANTTKYATITPERTSSIISSHDFQQQRNQQQQRQWAESFLTKVRDRWIRRQADFRHFDFDDYEHDNDSQDMNHNHESTSRQLSYPPVWEHYVRKNTGKWDSDSIPIGLSHYWDMGYSAPPSIFPNMSMSQITIHKRPLPPSPEIIINDGNTCTQLSPKDFPKLVRGKNTSSRCPDTRRAKLIPFLPLRSTSISSTVFHKAATAKLAARFLLVNSYQNTSKIRWKRDKTKITNLLLRTLYRKSLPSRHHALWNDALHHGQGLEVFCNHTWKNRGLVRKLLFHSNIPCSYPAGQKQHPRFLRKIIAKYSTLALSSSQRNVLQDVKFQYTPGAEPPVPCMPLDSYLILWGDPDPCMHSIPDGLVSFETAEITMATLLSQVMDSQSYSSTADYDTPGLTFWHQTLLECLKFILSKNQLYLNTYYHRYRYEEMSPDVEIYAVAEYHAWLKYCSYVANHTIITAPDGTHLSIYPQTSTTTTTARCASDVAEDMSFLQSILSRPHMNVFPQLHRIHILSYIASELPEDSADVFIRPCKSPLDTMRQTLEFLEAKGTLKDSKSNKQDDEDYLDQSPSKSQVMDVGHLEYIINKAAALLEPFCPFGCTTLSAVQLDMLGWLMAFRFSSLLLCSGIQIGGPAALCVSRRRTRSHHYDDDDDDSGDDDEDRFIRKKPSSKTCLPHEVRRKLPKFDDSRLLAAQTLQRLLQLPNGRSSDLIVPTLEWKQPMALMIGPQHDKPWRGIAATHAQHVSLISTLGPSLDTKAQHPLTIPAVDVVNHLAEQIERDPSTLNHWHQLIRHIGPFPTNVKGVIPKDSQALPQLPKRDLFTGWDSSRKEFWKTHLLTLPPFTPPNEANLVLWVKKQLQKHWMELEQETVSLVPLSSSATAPSAGTLYSLRNNGKEGKDDDGNTSDNDWLRRLIISLQPKSKVKHTDRTADKKLPPFPSKKSRKHSLRLEKNPSSIIFSRNEKEDYEKELELICYKLIILGHLCGTQSLNFQQGIFALTYSLFRKDRANHTIINAKKNTVSRALSWLSSSLGESDLYHILDLYYESLIRLRRFEQSPRNQLIPFDCQKLLKRYSPHAIHCMHLAVTCISPSKSVSAIRRIAPYFESWTYGDLQVFFKRYMKVKDKHLS
jgi:hypothetical protein